MGKLTEKDEILLKIAHLCMTKLPKDFAGLEANKRIWQAFRLGMMYNQLDKGEEYIRTLSRTNEILRDMIEESYFTDERAKNITKDLHKLVQATLGLK